LDAITIDVSRRQVSPLVIEVGLRSPDQNEELLRVPITLAAQARRESIPLPIASLIEASCDRYDIKRYEEDTQIKILQESRATVEDMAAKAAAAKEALSRAQLPVRNLSGEIEFIQLRIAYMKNEMQQKLAELDAAKQVLGQPPDDGRIASLSKEIRTLEMEVNNYSVRLNGLSNKLEEAKKLVQELEPEAVRLTKAAEEATKNAPTRTSEIIKSIERIKWDRVRNGSIRALANDDALRSGFCRLTLDRVSPLIIDPDILRLYGPQTLGVAVTLDGAPVESSTIWDVESPTAEFVLPPPSTEATPEKPYVIRAQVFDLSNRAVYRQGSFDVKREKISTDREYFYEARLRPRGPFGMSRYRVRYFLTVPLDLTAFRFPASRRELRASSDAGHVQVMTLRAGLLGAVEPWNYDSSRPLWKVPVRFMAGMNLVDLNNARVAPSILAGLSITAPLLDAPSQFGTSAAVGVFWETNLRDPQPFKSSHLIITLGLNIFSLFAAK
jgi:predicted  nucleic acid-binding Zn-ribbon protein